MPGQDAFNGSLEVFIIKQLDAIEAQASGRSKEQKEVRDGCQELKTLLRGAEFGRPGSRLSIPFSADVTDQLLDVIRAALALNSPKISEPALACLHKLVAYAYLQGETRPSGRLDDPDNLVTRVVVMTARCGDTSSPPVQLAVVRALLTLATAEHFVAHGDCLMLAVRTVFNIAMGGVNTDIQNTAKSALLQMMNTILKRVAQQIITPHGTPLQSPIQRMFHEGDVPGALPPSRSHSVEDMAGAQRSGTMQATPGAIDQAHASMPGLPPIKAPPNVVTPDSGTTPREQVITPTASAFEAASQQQHLVDARTAQLASLAEQADLSGLEKALDALPLHEITGTVPGLTPPGFNTTELTAAAVNDVHKEIREGPRSPLRRADTPPDPRRALMRERRAAEWKQLSMPERDAVIVITAMCKMAARETGPGAAGTYLHTGKLLALDTLVKVLTNPAHDWGQVRPLFVEQLRQPLSSALLRNCSSPYDVAVAASVTIFSAILAAQRLREGLKAEVGALYPILLLRPLELERPDSPAQALAALSGLGSVCGSPHVLVDVFVNYDCSLQAANLFERSIKALARYVQLPPTGGPLPPADVPKARAAALKALLAAIKSMDTWAGPLKSPPESGNGSEAGATGGEGGNGAGTQSPHAAAQMAGRAPHQQDILERIHLDKALKSNLQGGIATFNVDPVKGIEVLVGSGAVGSSPGEVVAFLREQAANLDPTAVGELMGHHSERSIQIMHSFIETERFAGLSLEAALRRLLSAFRLPGEAQKIDRIVEKFAERYCVENPGVFPIADAAYLLAFAIIMLNTDAHNPMAEGRLSQDDFVSMCTYQAEDGEFREILPPDEIKALYRNIVAEEIVLLGGEGVAAAAGAGTGSAPGSASKGKKGKEPGKLAAAVGLGQMSGPFWAGNAWDKQHGVDVERRRLLEVTAQLFDNSPGGGAGASLWRAATHAEHARPMMQVCGGAVAKALGAALSRAPSVQEAAPILYSYDQAIRLAALLYLEPLCEKLVSDLAAAASITSPAPPHTPLEARQVASLSRLISLGSCSEAGSLGSSWIYILRVLSDLEALKTSLSPASAPGGAQGGGAATAGSAEDSSAAGISSMGRLFARMGLSSTAAPPAASTTVVSERAGRRGPVAVREAPGMGAVIWAETVGAGLIDRTFAHSARLDGDAVLTFMRALCAASQEELDPGVPGAPPRVYLLNRVVECAFANGDRIRLVWQRLWTVVSQHLVSAACHPDQYVAMYAVEALRQLADKVLCRAELAGFSSQGDALRPFTAVLRGSDAAAVRELSTACIARAVDAHSARIGSGWRTVLEALGTAACDPSEAVVTQALDALAVVFGALYEPQGHACLAECVTAAMAAVGNPAPAAADLTTTGLYLFQTLARRLAEATASTAASVDSNGQGVTRRASMNGPSQVPSQASPEQLRDAWLMILSALAAVARADPRPKEADTAAALLFQILTAHAAGFTSALWADIFTFVLGRMLALPDGVPAGEPVASSPDGHPSPSSGLHRRRGAAPLPVSVSAAVSSPEGTARVLRHAAAHLPDLWTFIAAQPGDAAPAATLLPPSLQLLQSYTESADDAAAALGTEQLHSLLAQVGPGLGPHGWDATEGALREMIAVPLIPVTGGNAAAVRRRCRGSLLAMRCVAQSLRESNAAMPAAVQLDLLGALEDAVVKATSLNASPRQRRAMAALLNGGSWEGAMVAVNGAHASAHGPPGDSPREGIEETPDSESGADAVALAGAVRESGADWEAPLLPALARHEVEGGRMLLAALQQCAATPAALDADATDGVRAECERRLVDFALAVVRAAARRISGPDGAPAPAAAGQATWEDSMRAPLVADALRALCALPPGAWAGSKGEVFGLAARLVCSSELAVRKAVQGLMRAQAGAALQAMAK